MQYVFPFSAIDLSMIDQVGGKNASLGEMFQKLQAKGISVPDGFATSADAFREFIHTNQLASVLDQWLAQLDTQEFSNLHTVGEGIREAIRKAELQQNLRDSLSKNYQALQERVGVPLQLAVRSSATAEDLPSASFAGQLETYLNIEGEQELWEACRHCFASLYTDRAIKYRFDKGFGQTDIALSVGVQQMVRSDKACSGVAFTLDPDTGFDQVILITGSWGLGENVVQGTVNLDEFLVFKPTLKKGYDPIISRKMGDKTLTMVYNETEGGPKVLNIDTPLEKQNQFILTDEEVKSLAHWVQEIEDHYGRPMDIEWAKDGLSGKLFIVQARPETVHADKSGAVIIHKYTLQERGEVLTEGISLGQKIASGRARVLHSPAEGHKLQTGEILVTSITNPDWDPIMKRAAGIVTERGGRTSHAAIVARELDTVAIVGAENATTVIEDGATITLNCSEGSVGKVYAG